MQGEMTKRGWVKMKYVRPGILDNFPASLLDSFYSLIHKVSQKAKSRGGEMIQLRQLAIARRTEFLDRSCCNNHMMPLL